MESAGIKKAIVKIRRVIRNYRTIIRNPFELRLNDNTHVTRHLHITYVCAFVIGLLCNTTLPMSVASFPNDARRFMLKLDRNSGRDRTKVVTEACSKAQLISKD